VKRRRTNFPDRHRPVRNLEKARQDAVHQTCVFASNGICGSRIAFRSIHGSKRRHTIFLARVGLVPFSKKRGETRYAELVFLHLVGSAGHVVHSCASGASNIEALFFMVG
jgi:hypothetical protein